MSDPECFVTWQGRDEPPAQYARRFARMLTGLAAIDERFGSWLWQGRSRRTASRTAWQMPPDVEELTLVFERKRTRDLDGRLSDYAFSAWNGQSKGRPVVLRFFDFIGVPPERGLLSSRCELRISAPTSGEEVLSVGDLRRILSVMIEAWDGSFGNVSYYGYLSLMTKHVPLSTLDPGWMTYYSEDLSRRIVPPAEVGVFPGPFSGSIFQATRTPFDEQDPQHLAAGQAMQRAALAAFGSWARDERNQETRARLGWT